MKTRFLITGVVIALSMLTFAQSKPFPQNVNYAYGSQPTGFNKQNTNSLNYGDAQAMYNRWISLHYSSISGTNRARVKWDGWVSNSSNYSASEGTGYGMILTAYFGDKAKFDALLNFYNYTIDKKAAREGKARTELLCPWLVDNNSDPNWDLGGNGPATDGDIDAAYALIVANEQWPGNNYLSRAKEIISVIKNSYFEKVNGIYYMLPGDFGGADANDVSYYSPAYFKVFADVMNDASWDEIADHTYDHLWKAYEYGGASNFPYVFLPPDFQRKDGGAASGREYNYKWDASRIPWRLIVNYLWNGNKDSGYDWLVQASNWANYIGASNLKAGYSKDGNALETYSSMACTGGFACGMMVLDEAKVTSFATELKSLFYGGYNDNYFNLSTGCLYSLVLTGNFWKPSVVPPNNDDIITVSAPNEVSINEMVDVVIDYSASTTRDITTVFQLNSSPWTTYASVTKTVSAGSGSISNNIQIPVNTPYGNEIYQFQTFITEVGKGWNENKDFMAKGPVSCVATQSANLIPDGIYTIKSATNVYLTATTSGGILKSRSTENGNYTNWHFKHLGDEVYEISSVQFTGQRIELPYAASGKGELIAITTWNGDSNHLKWKATKVGSKFMFEPMHNLGFAMDAYATKPSIVHLWTKSSTNNNQLFTLTNASGASLKSTTVNLADTDEDMVNKIYPNPALQGGVLNIEVADKALSSYLYIISIDGKLVHQQSLSNSDFKITLDKRFRKGMYVVSVVNENSSSKNMLIVE